MSEDLGNLRSTYLGWGLALLVGFVAAALMMVLGDYSFSAAVFLGVLLAVVLGGFLTWLMRPLPRHGHATPVAAAVPHAAPAPSPVTAAPVMAAPAMAAPVMAAPVMAAPAAERPIAPDGKPELLDAARGGKPDDLKEIKGVGPKMEAMLHGMGIFHFDQVASWRAPEVAWVDENLEGFKGRVSRDEWVAQARVLAAGGTTEFSRRVEDGKVY
jgi:predicted flap endonuclease-1-like 5' DNA nuclease